jgi:hypothetical protein
MSPAIAGVAHTASISKRHQPFLHLTDMFASANYGNQENL